MPPPMVVRELDPLYITLPPEEADAPLVVDADAVLVFTVSA
jgi:hypothetical protein